MKINGAALKEIREKRRMSQVELAELVGLNSSSLISALENETRTSVSAETMFRLSQALDVPINAFVEDVDLGIQALPVGRPRQELPEFADYLEEKFGLELSPEQQAALANSLARTAARPRGAGRRKRAAG